MENGVLATGPELPRPSLTLLGQDLTCRSPAFWLIWIRDVIGGHSTAAPAARKKMRRVR
jgi:hypothetical protein